jgi:hypothetical protein
MMDDKVVMKGYRNVSNMWSMNIHMDTESKANMVEQKVDLQLLHERLGHANMSLVKRLGISYKESSTANGKCEVCQIIKAARVPYKRTELKPMDSGFKRRIYSWGLLWSNGNKRIGWGDWILDLY